VSGVESRRSPRHFILQRCFARPLIAGVSAAPEGWRSIAYNISLHGVGVTLGLPLKRGTVIEVEPWNLPGAKPLRARLVHASPLEFIWLCGCELDSPLSDAELQAWLVAARARP
jgi:hypothetical protein